MQLYIVMVTLNCVTYTQQALGSFRTRLPHNVLIVDNASTDRTNKLLDDLSKFNNQIHIRNKKRVSLSHAWNQALKLCMKDSEFKYAYVLNNDVILEPYCVDKLVKFIEEHRNYVLVSAVNTRDHKKKNVVAEDTVDFSGFLITRECIEKIGYFDENFIGAYFEDNDYHTRVKKAKLKSCLVQSIGYYHFGSKTLNQGLTSAERTIIEKNYLQNRDYFKKKWGFLPK